MPAPHCCQKKQETGEMTPDQRDRVSLLQPRETYTHLRLGSMSPIFLWHCQPSQPCSEHHWL